MVYIYRYYNQYESKTYYIGKTNDLRKRDSEHLKNSDWCYNALGLEYIFCDENMADKLEAYFIKKFKPLYNAEKPKYIFSFKVLSFVHKNTWHKFRR